MLNRETATFKRTYAEDMALYPAPLPRYTILVLLFLFFVVVPLVSSEYTLGVANLLGIASFGALGLNLLVGYTGQISIGHAAFMSVGAYTSAMLVSIMGLHWGLGMIAGGAAAAFLGMLVGIPSLRIKGLYLAISTLAAQLIIEWGINHLPFIPGGAGGSIYMDKPSIFGFQLKTNLSFYYFIYVVLVIGIVFALNLFRTHLGRSMIAVRDRDIAAEIIGINIFKVKLTAFGIASFYAGITGVLYTYYFGVANYEAFTLVVSIQFLAMIIIGGLGSVLGSVFGAVFISLLPIVLDIFLRRVGGEFMEESQIAAITTQIQLMLYGGLIMLFLVVEPDGLRKLWRNITDYFKVWPFPYL
ncbi:MAG: branched-chain amino acid ABC transporter permease [Candidatus Lambdaproteobacteria bacterium]|nr:branched-chain amino acid ABC transporter permease [Candidatus Lambdaproteobacteria bacterium]